MAPLAMLHASVTESAARATQETPRAQIGPLARPIARPGTANPAGTALEAAIAGRRAALLGVAAVASAAALRPSVAFAKPAAGDWSSPGLAEPEDTLAPRFFTTASGVKVQELTPGSGPIAAPGDAVLVDYVLRRSNGYFIVATVEGVSFQPRDVPVGPVLLPLGSGKVVPGLEEALVGMAPGGKRRVLVPAALGYTQPDKLEPQMPTFGTKRQLASHANEPLLFEVEVLKVLHRKGGGGA